MDPKQLGELQFSHRRTAARDDSGWGLWWEIALGVFVALMAHSIVTGLYVRWELHKAEQQIRAELQAADRQLQNAVNSLPDSSYSAPQHVGPTPLRSGERCISGRRFVRVDNGWRQVMEPC